MNTEELIGQLKKWIEQEESNAEESIQEYDNPEGANEYLAKAQAYRTVLEFVEWLESGTNARTVKVK